MLSTKHENILWAWRCPMTGIVWSEGWGETENYATNKTTRQMGKNRFKRGDMVAFRVELVPLTDAEMQQHRQAYADWQAAKAAKEKPAPTGED